MEEMLLTTRQAARQLGLQPETLVLWRLHGSGPPYLRLGACSVRYLARDIDAYIQASARPQRRGGQVMQ